MCICIDVKIYVITLCYFNKYFSFIRLRNPHYSLNNKDKYHQTSHYINFVKILFVQF